MVARVTLEIALRREFDYLIPPELEGRVEVGTRVKVPFGRRQVLGCVTGLAEQSDHETLKPIAKIIGAQSLVTPQVLELARWIAEYYCCAPETALKSVLPDAVRKEQEGWRERLHVRLLPGGEGTEALTKRQLEVYQVIEENRSLAMQELLKLTGTTAQTVRKLEDKGLVEIAPQISERDPYANEEIVPTQPLTLNTEQATALEVINGKPGDFFLLHGVTGSGKTEVYLQAIAHALEQGKGAIVLVPEIALTPQTVERFKARFSSGPLKTLVAVLHSHLSAGERHDEWHKIRQGRAKIVIGARSAIFAPVEPLGLIIVDEEHEPSYKQEESPRYHARDVAVVRGKREGACGARLRHAVHGELSQCQTRPLSAAGDAVPRRPQADAAGARAGYAYGKIQGRSGAAHLFAAPQGSDSQPAGAGRTDDFVPEPARLCDLDAVSGLRVCGGVPELQSVADVPPA